MAVWANLILNGLSFGMLLFLLSAGLALIFGVMQVLNLAHGVFYTLGAWIAISVFRHTGSLLVAAIVGILLVAILGMVIERGLLRYLPAEELPQALLTFGLMLILGDIALWVWGGTPQTLPRPNWLMAPVRLGGIIFPSYRLFVILFGVASGLALWFLQTRTRIGMLVRATVDDPEIAQSTGINVSFLSAATFAFGAGLAALGGVIGGPIIGVSVGTELDVLLLSFVVVIIGGLGSLSGAFIGAMIVGLIDSIGKAMIPEIALFTLFVPMVLILAIWPNGLFGRSA